MTQLDIEAYFLSWELSRSLSFTLRCDRALIIECLLEEEEWELGFSVCSLSVFATEKKKKIQQNGTKVGLYLCVWSRGVYPSWKIHEWWRRKSFWDCLTKAMFVSHHIYTYTEVKADWGVSEIIQFCKSTGI